MIPNTFVMILHYSKALLKNHENMRAKKFTVAINIFVNWKDKKHF